MASESTHFEYKNFISVPDLIYRGDTHVPRGKSFLRLTKTDDFEKPQNSSVGLVLYSKPVVFKASTGKLKLDTTIVFSITAVDDTPADGIAFFITRSLNLPSGGSDGNFGIFNSQTGTAPGLFAVEIDIFHNDWDPIPPHIGIDLESRVSLPKPTDVNTSLTGQEVTAVIGYQETDRAIDVRVTVGSRAFYHKKFYDLSDILGNEVYVGISSSTGDHVAVHDILSWSFDSYIAPN